MAFSSKASTACWSKAVQKTICGRGSGRQAATSIPEQPGILISRRSRSGLCSAANSIACLAVSASATISTSGCAASNWRRRARAGASSSAINARMSGSLGDFEPDSRAFREVLPVERGGVAIIASKAVGDVAEAVAGNRSLTVTALFEPWSVVRHFYSQAITPVCSNSNEPAALDHGNTVFDGVLDERLDADCRNLLAANG